MNVHIKHIVIYWNGKDLPPKIIYEKCCSNFPQYHIAYSTIKDWCKKLKHGDDILTRKIGSGIIQLMK